MARKPTGRPPGRPPGYPAFSRVARAREALRQSAGEYVKLHKTAAKIAASKGNSAPAEWALEHISEIEDGKEIRPIASGIDRQTIEAGSRAPTINIGWVIGPDTPQAQLPPAPHVLDIKPIDD